jgi:hypothetical protein
MNPTHLHVKAGVRYWEDATVNGEEDTDGSLIPFRNGNYWCPIIDITSGTIVNWPKETTADIHYKVCDDGEYWLANADGTRTHKWIGNYVPDKFLCPISSGYGDYIKLKVSEYGKIAGWKLLAIDFDYWKELS